MGHKRAADEAGIGPNSSREVETAGGKQAAADAGGAGSSQAAAAAADSSGKQQQVGANAAIKRAADTGGQPSKRSKVLDSLLDELEGSSSGDSSSQEGD